jgi:ATP-dependent DNA ligase
VDGIHLTPFETGEIGPDLFRHLEGLVSKHRERAYRAGQCPHWVKVKNRAHLWIIQRRSQLFSVFSAYP